MVWRCGRVSDCLIIGVKVSKVVSFRLTLHIMKDKMSKVAWKKNILLIIGVKVSKVVSFRLTLHIMRDKMSKVAWKKSILLIIGVKVSKVVSFRLTLLIIRVIEAVFNEITRFRADFALPAWILPLIKRFEADFMLLGVNKCWLMRCVPHPTA